MKISTKGRYALRLMLDLAEHDAKGPVRVRDVAARQGISEKYLEQIVSMLNRAGYVRSVRGPQGGYRLAKAPEEYTTGMILRLTEGSLAPVGCAETEGAGCEREDGCVTRMLWLRVHAAVCQVVDEITIADLLKWREEREAEG